MSSDDNKDHDFKEKGVVLDTPERTQIANPLSKFEDSPVFNYINSLSPIKPVKSVHFTQTFSNISFASLPSVFTSPHVSTLKDSKFLRRHQFSDPSKPELTSEDSKKAETSEGNSNAAQNALNHHTDYLMKVIRMETPVHPSAVGSKTPGQKWHIFSAVSKSLSAYKNKLQSPTVSSPFTLRTEERAARRKQKLEEKFNEKAAQKVQLQTTLKEKAKTEFRRLRQSFCFKARPLPSFYNEREIPKIPIKKTPQADLRSLTSAQKPSTTISQPTSIKKSSRRLWKTNDQNPNNHPLAALARRINHENISPNIQN